MLRSAVDYKYRKSTVEVRPLQWQLAECIVVSNESLEVVNKLSCCCDMISAGGHAEENIRARIRCGWKKFSALFAYTYLLLLGCFRCAQKVKFPRYVSQISHYLKIIKRICEQRKIIIPRDAYCNNESNPCVAFQKNLVDINATM